MAPRRDVSARRLCRQGLKVMRELALFAGAGGGILGGKLLGWSTRCAVEIDPYARQILLARQRDGLLDRFPIWDDVRTFDGRPWKGSIDVVSGGFPCQDISIAGKGAGISGERSGLWTEFARIIREVRPAWVFVENSPNLTRLGLDRVLGDLAKMGFDARWGVLGAIHAGAPHRRERIWIVAHSNEVHRGTRRRRRPHAGSAREPKQALQVVANDDGVRQQQSKGADPELGGWSGNSGWWSTEPDVGRMAHGVAYRMDRLRALGNGQVPAVAKLAFELLSEG